MRLPDITEKPVYCKSCFQKITLSPIRKLWERQPLLCNDCISQIRTELLIKYPYGVKTLFLSDYQGLMKTWLMNYKEYGDIELAPCFLNVYLLFLRQFLRQSLLVPLPSKAERIKARGFDHLETMLKASGLNYCAALRQKSSVEQKNRLGANRFASKGIELTESAIELSGKKVVLFDDVMTTGATFHESLLQIQKINPRKIFGLILMDNFKPDELQIH